MNGQERTGTDRNVDIPSVGEIQHRRTAELIPYADNARVHTAEQVKSLVESIRTYGFIAPVVVDNVGVIVAGHGRVLAAEKLGMEFIPCVTVDHLTSEQVRAYRIIDNKIASTEWDTELLAKELRALAAETGINPASVGFSEAEFKELMSELTKKQPIEGAGAVKAFETITDPVTKLGDIWVMDNHRLICGDCTNKSVRESLMSGNMIELILTDPPYSSGGFQESGKHTGSIGSDSKKTKQIRLINDTLSTRGYMALMSAALSNIPCIAAYVFTDWRMWVNLYDSLESSGYGVRSMIVWDKQSPGMGNGWRTQHELIAFAVKAKLDLTWKASLGNVIQCNRTGNEYHPTEKPVELLEKLMSVIPDITNVYDPFAGSGSTLIACEYTGRVFYGCELDGRYCDMTVRRWEELTGQKAERIPAEVVA